jgi:circadian clock protein KaiC
MSHSNQIREFKLTNHGIDLLDVYVGAEGVLTGSARLSQETRDNAEQLLRQQEIGRKQYELERKREAMEAQIIVLRSEFESEKSEAIKGIRIDKARSERFAEDKTRMAKSRKGDVNIRPESIRRKRTHQRENPA